MDNKDNKINQKEIEDLDREFVDMAAPAAGGNDHYKYFQNFECPFFPCHKNIPVEEFNCIFCFCPLYSLNKDCGGNYKLLSNGVKDCSGCTLPHYKQNYGVIVEKSKEMINKVTEANLKEMENKNK